VSKALARLGLKFSKDRPETFSHEYSPTRGSSYEVRLDQEQYEHLLKEIRSSMAAQQGILEPILFIMTELATYVEETLELTKVKSASLKEFRDFSKEIEDLLAARNQLTFSEIQEQLDMTAPTLSSHLEKLTLQNKLDRIVVGRNVVYRLRNRVSHASL
jgi:Fic family protein